MVKFGLIGTGNVQDLYRDYVQNTQGISWSGNWTRDADEPFNEFIERTDALVILDIENPFDMVQQAFRFGRHVLLDSINKLSLDEIDRVLTSRKEAGVHFHSGVIELFHPAVMSLKKQEIAPRFIEAYHSIEQHEALDHDLVLQEILSDIAVIHHLVQSDVKRIAANALKSPDQAIKLINARLEFANGCVAVLTLNQLRNNHAHRYIFYEESRSVNPDLHTGESQFSPIMTDLNSESLTINSLHDKKDAHINRINDFTQSLLENTRPMLKLRDTYKQVEVAHKILKKINSLPEE